MCVVSFIGDHYKDKWTQPTDWPHWPITPISEISRAEFDALKKDVDKLKPLLKEVEDMKKLLIKAKEYDERNNEPNCEMDNKVALLKRIAEMVGVDLSDVFPKK